MPSRPCSPLVAVGASLAALIVVSGLGTYSGVAAGAPVAPQQREVCAETRLPHGWIVVDARWSATTCGPTEGIQDNVWVIERYDDRPEDTTLTVCAFAPVPPGWVVESTSWSATRCGEGSPFDHNVKTIRRLGRGARGGGSPPWSQGGSPGDERVTGIYSDLRLIEETGDVLGAEIILLASHGPVGELRYHALVQFAEGALEPPQLVSVDVIGSELRFVASYAGIQMPFMGQVERNVLEGSFDGPIGRIRLPRARSFWE